MNPLVFSLLPVPSKPPTNVKVVSSTLSSIKVSWGPIPKDGRNGNILGYVVFYREDTSGSWSERDVSLVYAKELTGLTSGKLYSVRVAGYTKIGRGTRSRSTRIIVGGSTFTRCFYPKEKRCLPFALSISFFPLALEDLIFYLKHSIPMNPLWTDPCRSVSVRNGSCWQKYLQYMKF